MKVKRCYWCNDIIWEEQLRYKVYSPSQTLTGEVHYACLDTKAIDVKRNELKSRDVVKVTETYNDCDSMGDPLEIVRELFAVYFEHRDITVFIFANNVDIEGILDRSDDELYTGVVFGDYDTMRWLDIYHDTNYTKLTRIKSVS